jgi:hypothetical protein
LLPNTFELSKMRKTGTRESNAPHPKINIPRDTMGNALPFPVPSGKICRLKPEEWEGMWRREALGTLPVEYDCSICGDWFGPKEIFPMDRTLIHPIVQRQALNTTLQDIRICKDCKAHCTECKKIIPRAQKKKANDMCQNCNAEAKNIPKPKHYPRH